MCHYYITIFLYVLLLYVLYGYYVVKRVMLVAGCADCHMFNVTGIVCILLGTFPVVV